MAQWQDRGVFHENHPFAKLHRILNWSLYVGRPVAGIPLHLHWTLLISPLVSTFLAAEAWGAAGHPFSIGDGVAVFLFWSVLLYGIIYLHELGHAITAQQLGHEVHNIVLYLLGGVMQGYGSRTPHHEFAIVAFGPMVNFVLVGVASLFHWLVIPELGLHWTGGWWIFHPAISWSNFFFWMFWLNLSLGVFNLIPLFPLDGSKMLRSLLSLKHDPTKMTYRIATFGQWVLAPALIIYGLFAAQFGILLILIAIWGIQACSQEKMLARHGMIYQSAAGGGQIWQAVPGGWHDPSGYGAVYGGYAADREPDAKPKKKGFFARRREEKARKRAEKERESAAAERAKMDELLAKIHDEGIGALSEKEKAFLKNASKRYQD